MTQSGNIQAVYSGIYTLVSNYFEQSREFS